MNHHRLVPRLVACGLPLVVLVAGLSDTNVWPATGWRLFSLPRTDTLATWIIEVEDASGSVRRFDPAASDPSQARWRRRLDVAVDDPSDQHALCRRWLEDARAGDPTVRGLSVRRAVTAVPTEAGAPAPVRSEREVVRCRG